MHFAKVFTIGDHQILFTLSDQREVIGDYEYGISTRIDLDDGNIVTSRSGFAEKKTRDLRWESIDENIARFILSNTMKMYG
jgi:hypothetical protein